MSRPPAIEKRESSGGVIYRYSEGVVEVALVVLTGRKAWCLPKGIIDKGEDPPTTALREVREETGLFGEMINKLGYISYWYFLNNNKVKVHKTVHYYLLKFVSGNTNDHDHEVEEVKWFPVSEAVTALSYKNEREIMLKAKDMIEKELDAKS
jgi:8-oxo-dGTP pyrophosphatase MutT (NUDIX family)